MNNKISITEKIYFTKLYIRALFYKALIKKMGSKVFIDKNFICSGSKNVELGSHTYINHDVEIDAQYANVKIGKDVMLGPYVYIGTKNYGYKDYKNPMRKQKYNSGTVEIEDDVWIGTKSIILPGTKIGRGVIIGAGAVVTNNVPPFAIVGGVPARVIKYRFDKKIIQQIMKGELKHE